MRKSVYTSLFTLLAFWIVASFAQAQQIVTDIKDGAKVYIRYNAGTAAAPKYYYWNAGQNYGTAAVTDVHGVEISLSSATNGTYYLHSSIANNDGTNTTLQYLKWDQERLKCDKEKSTAFVFDKVKDNIYTIKFSSNTVTIGSNPVGDKLTIGGSTQWEVITREQLKKELENASSSNPVDATHFISDPGFGRNVVDTVKNKWKIYNATTGALEGSLSKTVVKVGNTQIVNLYSTGEGDGMMSVLKISNSDGSLYKAQQTLTGLPNGKYRVSVQGSSKNDNVCYLFADNGNSEVTSSAFTKNISITDNKKAYSNFTGQNASDYVRSVEVQVLDGTLTIGVKNNSASPKADVFVDNFELYCLEVNTTTFYNPIGVSYTPEAVDNSSWKELTTSSNDVINHPEKYFFTVWVNDSTLLGLKNGEDGEQGSEYKTMGCFSNVNPLDNKEYLWELYKVGYLKYVFVNPTSRENMVQAEDDDTRYFRFSESTAANTTNAIITVQKAEYSNWMLKTSKGQYLRPWNARMLDVIADSKIAYFKIYAIPRTSVVVDGPYEQIQATLASDAYTNSNMSFDASLLMSNSDAMGTNDDVVRGWTNTGNVKTVSPVAGEDGRKSCFTFPTSSEGSLSQTLNGMHAGVYTLTAHVIGGKGTLFIGDAETAITGAGTFEVEKYFDADNCDVTFGAKVGNSSESALQIDYFTLRYSISKDFYVRKNIGSDSEPEYLYVAGGTHNNNVVMAKHGTEFTAVGRGASTLSGFEDSQSVVLKTGTYTSSGNIGYLGLDANNKYAVNFESVNKSLMLFKPVDATNKYYMYSASNNKYVDGSNTLYSDLTQSNSATTPFELVSKSQLLEELKNASATPATPVDATFLIDDPDFSKGNMKKSSWKVSNGTTTYDLDGAERVFVDNSNNKTTIQNYGDNNNFVRIVVYTGPTDTYYVQQTLTGLPKGYYRLSAQGIGRLNATGNAVGAVSMYLFAKNGEGTEKSEKFDEYNYFTASSGASVIEDSLKKYDYENYKKTIEVYVGDDGILTIGAKTGNKFNAAFIVDNFELYYIGKRSADSYAFNLTPVDFSVNGLNGNMVEVTPESTDVLANPQNYFFTIWENSTTCLALADGTSGYQGADYKTMSYGSNPDLANDLSCLWEFYKTADGKFVMINATDREHMMQTEEDADFFRYNDATTLDVAKASVEFQPSSSLNNWIINTPKGYVHRWNKDFNDIVVDEIKGYYKIYAIPRRYYVMDVLRAKYGAYSGKPKDVTLLLANPEAAGTSGSRTVDIPAWKKSGTGNVITKEGDSNAFNVISGKSFFQIDGSKDLQISQTVSNLLAGKYRLCVSVKEANVAYLYVGTKKCAFNDGKYVSNGTLSFEFECDDNASVTYGVKLSGKSTGVQFDNFRLYYLGNPNHIYTEPLTAGEEYYIRALNSEGEYRYLEAGNSWGTAAVFTEHGIEYRFEDANATQDGYPLYYLNSGIVGGRGQYLATANEDGTGGFFNDSKTLSWYFIPRGDEYPFQYRMVYKKNGKNVTYDETITSGPNLVFADTENADTEKYVEIVPKYVRMVAFDQASYTKPVDATFLIKDPDFNIRDIRVSEWNAVVATDTVPMAFWANTKTVGDVDFVNNGGGDKGNIMVKSKDGVTDNVSFNFFQKITDVPNGHYIISASGVSTKAEALWMYVSDSENNLLGLTVFGDTDEDSNFKNIALNTNSDAANNFLCHSSRQALFRHNVEFDVTDGTMVIGFRGTAKEFKAFFDNIELKYCGPTTEIAATNTPGNNFKPEKIGSKWVEVSKLGSDGPLDNPGDYLFTIWKDNKTCLALDNGTDAYQGSSYKTMAYTNVTADPINNLNQLWEIYQNDYGVKDGKFVLVNASSREMMMQAEEGTEYFRFRELVSQKNDKAVVCINDTILGNGSYIKFKITSECSNRELGRWSSNAADVKMVTANGDYYKLYAIKRADYYTLKDNIMYTASTLTPVDVSLLVGNPNAFGEVGNGIKGWAATGLSTSESAAESFNVGSTDNRNFSVADGNTYLEFTSSNNETISAKLSQTIYSLPRGIYLLKVVTNCAGSNANLYMRTYSAGVSSEPITEELSTADSLGVVQVAIEIKEGEMLELGLDLSQYKHIKSDEDEEDDVDDDSDIVVKFDKFILEYFGVQEVLASALSNGTYYIRTDLNYGTDKAPEYRYLDAGGNKWGTDPIMNKHGMAFVLTETGTQNHNDKPLYKSPIYSIKSMLQQGNSETGGEGAHGRMFDGLQFDHGISKFLFEKVHPDDEESYEYKMISMYAHTNISGSTQHYRDTCYVVKSDNESLELKPIKNSTIGDKSAIWEIVTKTQRVKELQNASQDNPLDATFFITDPSFGRNNIGKTSWTLNVDGTNNVLPRTLGDNDKNDGEPENNKRSYGNIDIAIGTNVGKNNQAGSYLGNKYDFNVIMNGKTTAKSSYNLSQSVDVGKLPTGVYRLSVHGYTNMAGGAVLYAADENKELGSVNLHIVNGKESELKYLKDHKYAAYWFTGNDYMADQDALSRNILNKYKRDNDSDAGKYYYMETEFTVTSNTLVIGVRGELSSSDYVVLDNFELYYLGEAPQDISKIEADESRDLYLYNVDAGLYLNYDATLVTTSGLHYTILKDNGQKFKVKPVTDKDGKKVKDQYYIYTVKKSLTEDGQDIVRYLGGGSSAFNMTYVDYASATKWIITPVESNNDLIYTIKGSKGQVLEWTGDAKNYVYSGFAHDANNKPQDKEPRGYRWAFYDPNQYAKDRSYTKIASSARSDGWRYVRSAIVNMRDLVDSDTIPGLSAAYNRLDASWINPLATKSAITQLVSELKQVMMDALVTRGTTQKPVDVSFFIQNAGVGVKDGWKGTFSVYNNTKNSNSEKFMPSIYQLVRLKKNQALSQDIHNESNQKINVPAGKYMLSVDVRTVTQAHNFQLQLSSKNHGTALMDTLDCISGTSGQYDVFSTPFLELENADELSLSVKNTSSSGDGIAVDNFKLYFGGNIRGKLKFNEDRSEVTMLGDWDDDDELYSKAKDILQENLNTLGAMHINKDNVILRKGVNVTDLGWQKGNSGDAKISNNILFYTDFAESDKALDKTSYAVEGSANVVRKGGDSKYYCDTLLITDNMTMHVPYSFHADTIGYSRTNPVRSGTLCLPFDLTKLPNGISKLCVPDVVDWEANPSYGKLLMTEYSSGMDDVVLPANTPVFYDGVYGKDVRIDFSEKDAIVYATSELTRPTADTASISLFGNYLNKYVVGESGNEEYGVKNGDGLSADECYYLKKVNNVDGDCMLVRGKHWFNVGPFRAFVYRGKNDIHNEARPSSLYIDYGDLLNSVDELDNSESVIIGYYDVKGIRYDKPQKGLNIIMFSDGTRRKAYMK